MFPGTAKKFRSAVLQNTHQQAPAAWRNESKMQSEMRQMFGGRSTEPPVKKARAREDNPDTESIGAAEHGERMAVAAAIAQEQPDRDTGAQGPPGELVHHGAANDHALIQWLRARQTQPRCGTLFAADLRMDGPGCEPWPKHNE